MATCKTRSRLSTFAGALAPLFAIAVLTQTLVGRNDGKPDQKSDQEGVEGGTAVAFDSRQTPVNLESLTALEELTKSSIRKTMAAVVAVEGAQGPGFASGVIVTPEGLILSEFHVSHRLDLNNRSRKVGQRVKVILHDGRKCEAELLGADITCDFSLLRMSEPGPYPYARLDKSVAVKRGDWVIKLGHPGGYVKGRRPVARLGRVVVAGEDQFVSDCQNEGGDSGGPYFDLQGRLVGVSGSGVTRLMRDRVDPMKAFFPSVIASKMTSMFKGEIAPIDHELRGKMGRFPAKGDALDAAEWAQGNKILSMWQSEAIQRCRSNVVEVLDDNQVVAFGTIVGKEGWILTKASELPAHPKCRLPDGAIKSPQVVGADPAFDLALLKVAANNLDPVRWVDKQAADAGTFVASPALSRNPLVAGIVSVPERSLDGPFPTTVVHATYKGPAARPPALLGSAVQGRGYWVEFAEAEAAAAGIQPGDVVISVGGMLIRGHDDLVGCVDGFSAGQRLDVRLLRAGKPVEVSLQLRSDRPASPPRDSFRRSGFPSLFEHDIPLNAHECGGPVVNLRGESLGITISRVGGHGCMAIPASVIQRILPELKNGKPLAVMPEPQKDSAVVARPKVPQTLATGKAVTMKIDELRQRLEERARRYENLFVDYDTVTEAIAQPLDLAAWNMNILRDHSKRVREGFAGEKRYHQVTLPAIDVRVVPLDKAQPAKNAPSDIAQQMRERRQRAAASSEKGKMSHLFTLNDHRMRQQTSILSGNACFREWGDVKLPMRPDEFSMERLYLASIGLRPIDPQPPVDGKAVDRKKLQQQYWFPKNFDLYSTCRILPNEEIIEGAPCIVVEAEWKLPATDKVNIQMIDRIWFDPAIGFAPRKWNQRVNGNLENVRANSDFEEMAPGCWLPWESTWTVFPPAWASKEYRDLPAYRFNIHLRRAYVNRANAEAAWPETKMQARITMP